METISQLKSRFPRHGTLTWIGRSARRAAPVESVETAEVQLTTGILGDHHATQGRSDRHVTLIQFEHLAVIAKLLGRDEVGPELLRRNLVVSGINLLALTDREFRVGDVVLRGSGLCVPCSRMEANLGPGGYNAVRGHGGITATVVTAGQICVGDAVSGDVAS